MSESIGQIENKLLSALVSGGIKSLLLVKEIGLNKDMFVTEEPKLLFGLIEDIYKYTDNLDLLHLQNKIEEKKLSAILPLSKIKRICGIDNNDTDIKVYAKLIVDNSKRRLLEQSIIASKLAIEKGLDYKEISDNLLSTINEISIGASVSTVEDSETLYTKTCELIKNYINKDVCNGGVGTGFKQIDKLTTGFHKDQMIVIAARPGLGKSAIGINIINDVIYKQNKKALLFSLEMSSEQIILRGICSYADLDISSLRDGDVTENDKKRLRQTLLNLKKSKNLYIDDNPNQTIFTIATKSKMMKHKMGDDLSIIVIDYIQLITGDKKLSREQQVSEISRGCKILSKELAVPVVVLTQLNRESEKENRYPRLSDIRESGSIEQDADIVMFISKQPCKNPTERDIEESHSNIVDRALLLSKQRNGSTGIVDLVFHKSTTTFKEL